MLCNVDLHILWKNLRGLRVTYAVFGGLSLYMCAYLLWYSSYIGVDIKESHKVLLCLDQSIASQFILLVF